MKKYLFPLLVVVLMTAIITLTRCYYDSEKYLYSNVACDTGNVTYSGTIQTIVDTNCKQCHNVTTQSGGVNLEGYDNFNLKAERSLIRMRDPARPMPTSGMLDACTSLKMEAWITNGKKNN